MNLQEHWLTLGLEAQTMKAHMDLCFARPGIFFTRTLGGVLVLEPPCRTLLGGVLVLEPHADHYLVVC